MRLGRLRSLKWIRDPGSIDFSSRENGFHVRYEALTRHITGKTNPALLQHPEGIPKGKLPDNIGSHEHPPLKDIDDAVTVHLPFHLLEGELHAGIDKGMRFAQLGIGDWGGQ